MQGRGTGLEFDCDEGGKLHPLRYPVNLGPAARYRAFCFCPRPKISGECSFQDTRGADPIGVRNRITLCMDRRIIALTYLQKGPWKGNGIRGYY